MNWTEEELIAYQERQSRHKGGIPIDVNNIVPEIEPDPGPEHNLQDRIEGYCRDHAIPFFHDRSRRMNTPGFPDLIIALPGGKTLWLELKSKTGRLDPDQKKWRLMLLRLNHEWYQVKSFRSFLRIVNGEQKEGIS
jgi:hypothetical protein